MLTNNGLKKCKQCGELRAVSLYRKYYAGRKGSYTTCKICERINNRHKYLDAKGPEYLSKAEETELQAIQDLWQAQRLNGLRPPGSQPGSRSVQDDVLSMLSTISVNTNPLIDLGAPQELVQWLSLPLVEEPEYYQDTVYETLRDKYRPIIRIDPKTLTTEYDDTYKNVLDAILERFDDYEDSYYNPEE